MAGLVGIVVAYRFGITTIFNNVTNVGMALIPDFGERGRNFNVERVRYLLLKNKFAAIPKPALKEDTEILSLVESELQDLATLIERDFLWNRIRQRRNVNSRLSKVERLMYGRLQVPEIVIQ